MRDSFVFTRTVLLVEITRRCSFSDCNGVTSIALVEEEAIEYNGFECVRCKRWNDDELSANETPAEWSR